MDRDNSASKCNISDQLMEKNTHESENKSKGINLSSLTSKYNKSRNVGEVFVCDNKYNQTSLSDDDCSESESSPSSLAALVAKHNIKKALQTKPEIISTEESTLGNQQDKIRLGDYNDVRLGDYNDESSDSDVDGPSLMTFALKLNNSQTVQPRNLGLDTDASKSKDTDSEEFGTGASTISDLTVKFRAAKFSDDSDSDNSSKPLSMAFKHLNKPEREIPDYAIGCSLPKPRELLVLAKGHRQHTKSESDHSNPQIISRNLVGTRFEKEMSTSLGSLKGSSHKQTDFQFSLGCAIPNSFQSKNVDTLSSSLSSFQAPLGIFNMKNSFSDPDVSIKANKNKENTNNSSDIMSSHMDDKLPVNIGCEIGLIDLISAIKSSSSINIGDSENQNNTNTISISNEHDDEKIVTLLDTLCVDEEMIINDDPEKNKRDCYGITDFANINDDSCMKDASFMLDLKFKMRTKKCSALGKVICRRWRVMKTPYIRSQKLQTSLVPFNFSTPSPDDVVDSYRRHDFTGLFLHS